MWRCCCFLPLSWSQTVKCQETTPDVNWRHKWNGIAIFEEPSSTCWHVTVQENRTPQTIGIGAPHLRTCLWPDWQWKPSAASGSVLLSALWRHRCESVSYLGLWGSTWNICRLPAPEHVYIHDKLVFTGDLHGGRRCELEHVCVRRWNWICVVSLTLHVTVELNGANPSWCTWSSFKEVQSPGARSFPAGCRGSKSSQWMIRTVRRIKISEEQKVNVHFIPEVFCQSWIWYFI